MAAGKTLKVKLRYRPSLSRTAISTIDTQDPQIIRKVPISSAPEDDTQEPVMDHPPLDHLDTSLEYGNPSSVPPPPPPIMPLTTAAVLRRRRKESTHLKRPASTPDVRGLANSEAGMTLVEKRRNKLGYHRTSVACGHCRRRKIRCLLAPDDPQQRCANCIRLKKDCNFFPVDQQPQIDNRSRHSPRADTLGSTSSDSSPALPGGHLLGVEILDPYGQLPLPASFPARGSIGELVSPMTQAPLSSHALDYPQPRTWDSPFSEHPPTSAGYSSPDNAPHYWGRHAESPMTPGFSPHLSGPMSTPMHSSDRSSLTSFAPSRRDSAWSMPSRSASIGGIVEDLPAGYQTHFQHPHAMPSMSTRRQASDMQPPSLQTSANSSNTSISEAHMTPLSAPISSPPIQHWGIPANWSTLPSNDYAIKAPDYGSWYAEVAPLAKVQEEELGPHFGTEPAILHTGAGY